MDTLDSSSRSLPNNPIWNTVLRYGLYCAGAFVVFSLLLYLVNFNMMTFGGMAVFYVLLLAISFTFAIMAQRAQRDQVDGGYITYGKALLVGLATVLLGVFVSSFWNYILVNFIDPGYVDSLKEQFIETWGEQMPAESLEQALEGFDKSGDLLNTIKQGLIGGVIYGLIVGLISAAFTKKQPEIPI